MRQRESAIEREKVESEIMSARAADLGASSSSSSSSSLMAMAGASSSLAGVGGGGGGASSVDRAVGRVAPEELVDALTIRLAEKIRSELQLEDRAELSKVQAKVNQEKAQVNKLEGFLAKEIASHKCPICYELMVPPDHSPLLLFPCGHTFCR